MSHELVVKIQLGLEELSIVREQITPLISIKSDAIVGVIETAAACAMLHSFYTEIEKIFKLIARDWDGHVPSSNAWHKDLLNQMSETTAKRPAVVSPPLIEVLGEFLAFRHLFRGASNSPHAMGEAYSADREGRLDAQPRNTRNRGFRAIH